MPIPFSFWAIVGLVTLLSACRAEVIEPLTQPKVEVPTFQLGNVGSSETLSELSFGMASESIEPSEPSGLAGFGGVYRRVAAPAFDEITNRFFYFLPFQSVDIPPHVKVMLWKGNTPTNVTKAFVVVAVDLVAVTADVTLSIVDRLKSVAPELNLSSVNVRVIASHTHSAQGGLSRHPLWSALASERFSPKLHSEFEDHIAAAFKTAKENLKPVGNVVVERDSLTDYNKTRILGVSVDKQYTRVTINDRSDSQIGCLQVYAVHPTFFGQRQRVLSADIPGHIEQAYTEAHQAPCYFMNGAVGNADAPDGTTSIDEFAAQFVKQTTAPTTHHSDNSPTLKFGTTLVDLPPPHLNTGACGFSWIDPFFGLPGLSAFPKQSRVGYIAIGGGIFINLPGEPIGPLAEQIQAGISKKHSFEFIQVMSTTDDYLGYFVTPDIYPKQNLEACSTLFGKTIADVLTAAVVNLVDSDL